MSRHLSAVCFTLGLVLAAVPLQAQARQRLSLQGSGAVLFPTTDDPTFDSDTRLGWEAQLRYTFSRFSLGGGYQRSRVFTATNPDFDLTLSLVFLEPRYVLVAGSTVAFYLAGRVGFGDFVCSEQCNAETSKITVGGGGGFLVKLTSRFALDLGGQWFQVDDQRSSSYTMARAGLSIGL